MTGTAVATKLRCYKMSADTGMVGTQIPEPCTNVTDTLWGNTVEAKK